MPLVVLAVTKLGGAWEAAGIDLVTLLARLTRIVSLACLTGLFNSVAWTFFLDALFFALSRHTAIVFVSPGCSAGLGRRVHSSTVIKVFLRHIRECQNGTQIIGL